MNFFLYSNFESEALSQLSRSPRQPSMESRIRRLKKFKFVSNENIRNKIPFLHVYIDLNLHRHPKRLSYVLNKAH